MLEELRALLAKLRAADDLPYATLSDAGSAEARAMGFWSRTGPEGAALGTAITAEFWRLHGL